MSDYYTTLQNLPLQCALNVPFAGLICGPTDWPVIKSISYRQLTTTGGSGDTIGITVSSSAAVLRATAYPLQSSDPTAPGADILVGVDFTTFPTLPTNFLRRQSIQTVQFLASMHFVFPRGWQMSPNYSLLFWRIFNNAGSSGAAEIDLEVAL